MFAWAKRVVRAVAPAPLYRRYEQHKVVRQISSYRPRVVEHRYGDCHLRVSLEDPLAEAWYDRDWPELKEIAVLREHGLGHGARVFDLGAHQGVVAMMLADLVGGTGRVIAVEAERHNIAVCRRNLALNDAANVEAVWAAVSDSAGEILFAESLCGRIMPGNSWGKIRVPATTIDELAERYGTPVAVLLDVEGAEMLALEGGRETIRRGAQFVVEIHAGCGLEEMGAEAGDVLDAFADYQLLISPGDEPGDWQPPIDPIGQRTFLFARPR